VRRRVIDYVNDYRRRGNAAMVVYDDRGSVRASDALAPMMSDSSFTFSMIPALRRLVVPSPSEPLPDVKDVMFWSVDEMPHVRPTLRIIHRVVYAPAEVPGMTVVAAK